MVSGILGALGAVRPSFADLLAYLLSGAMALALFVTLLLGPAALPDLVDTQPKQLLVVIGLVVFSYPVGFLLAAIGDITIDAYRYACSKLGKDYDHPLPCEGLDDAACLILSRFLFPGIDDMERSQTTTAEQLLWIAQAVGVLAPDQLPGWNAGFNRNLGILRFMSAMLGTGVVGVAGIGLFGLGAPAYAAGTLIAAAVAFGMLIGVMYVGTVRFNNQLTREILQASVAIAASKTAARGSQPAP